MSIEDSVKVSVFTPSHDPKYLDDCYDSLRLQTFDGWEWIVLLNNGASQWPKPDDDRVQVHCSEVTGVGEAKAVVCAFARGEILVELDHDDMLLPDALQEVVDAFEADPSAALVYSQFTQVNVDGSPDCRFPFGVSYGWQYDEILIDGRKYIIPLNMDCSIPHNSAYIWYAPNHLRAFRREVYHSVGGYDKSLDILDDQDLMCRLFMYGSFHEIPKCLYKQRVHDSNTQADPGKNSRIQVETVDMYEKYIQAMMLAWCSRKGLLAVDLGSAHGKPPGYIGVDLHDSPHVDWVGDVYDYFASLPDNSVGVIRAVDFLEHLPEKIQIFNEMHRVLVHGGMLLSLTPSTDGRGAFQDPTHISFYNVNSFWYYTQPEIRNFVPGITAKFQTSHIRTGCPTQWHVEHEIHYVNANLLAVKDGLRLGGLLH